MKPFLDENFLLHTDTAQHLYHNHAANLPIIDYHCHLDPSMIAADRRFDNLGQIWLEGDHYKWRAMRANGIEECYCTGNASDWEKFEKWAATAPYTMRNPLYHWMHLELRRAFAVDKILNPSSAKEIYDECSKKLQQPEYSARGLMRMFNVETVCTTDDPADSLQHHIALKNEGFEIKTLPTWRPDKAMAVENPAAYRAYIEKLAEIADVKISKYADLLEALQKRHDFFAQTGCKLSDHGTEEFYAEDYTLSEIEEIFNKVFAAGKSLTRPEILKFKTALMVEGARMDHAKGWTQQFHYGCLRNNNTRLFNNLGADTGFDSIGDFSVGKNMAKFFDILDSSNQLAKTIIYNLNPCDNELIAAMTGNFQDGSVAGKMQFGSGWWFLDQKKGMEEQINTLSALGLLSRFVGMLTDSRSFLSYPRHEYFRRILCNLIGNDVENGELPASEMQFIEQIVKNVCYYNAKEFFDF